MITSVFILRVISHKSGPASVRLTKRRVGVRELPRGAEAHHEVPGKTDR